jgi:hypothetical protein
VVVPRPQVNGKEERLQLAASGVLTASLNTLGTLDGVAAIDPSQLLGAPSSVQDMSGSGPGHRIGGKEVSDGSSGVTLNPEPLISRVIVTVSGLKVLIFFSTSDLGT